MGELSDPSIQASTIHPKTVLYVYDGDWPRRATRVGKQTRSLARGGHRVHLISRNDLCQALVEETGWMTVHRLPAVSPRWLNRLINFPLFFNPVWLWAILRSAQKAHAEILVVRDLPLALTAIAVGHLLSIPVIYDMAEVYPEFLRDRVAFGRMSLTDYLVRNPQAAEVIERKVLQWAHKIIVVSEESWERCVRLGVDPARLALVGNTPDDLEAIAAHRPAAKDNTHRPDTFTLLFVGILMWDRGVAEAVMAMPRILEACPETKLIVVGDGDERAQIERGIVQAGVEASVIMLGYRDHASLPQLYAEADIGLLPFLPGRHVKITLANKLFDYMAAGLPIIAADLPPMRRVLEETGAGELFTAGDSDALATAVIDLLRDPVRRERLGANGRLAAESKYRWAEDARRLLSVVGE